MTERDGGRRTETQTVVKMRGRRAGRVDGKWTGIDVNCRGVAGAEGGEGGS